MAEDKKPTESGGSFSGIENTAKVTFGDTEYTIHRLKAGKFYEALKVYMDMIKEIAPQTPVQGKGEATVDFDKLVVSMFQTWPEKMVKFIAVCCSTMDGETKITEKQINDDSYPEQITEAFRTCLKLNRVGENLKNFVAPIGELGAEVQPKQ